MQVDNRIKRFPNTLSEMMDTITATPRPARNDGIIYKRNIQCELCNGKGKIEEVEYDCDSSTGYNSIPYGTGRFIKCPDCQ